MMNLKFNGILKLFKNTTNIKNNKNYIKNKNIYLIISFTILMAAIGFVVVFFNFFKYDLNFKYKTIVNIPYTKSLSDDDLEIIKDISSDIFNTNCTVQTSIAFPEIRVENARKISINFMSNISKKDPSNQKNIDLLINKLTNTFPKQLAIKNKEEVLITNIETADIEDYNPITYSVVLSIILALILLYFIITFRKINGFLVSFSFLIGLIFNIAIILALFLVNLIILNLDFNNMTILPLIAILSSVILNYIINSNMLFFDMKNQIMSEANENSFNDIANNAINKQMKNLISNLLIFIIVPGLTLLFLNISSVSFLAFAVMGLISGFCCFLFSNFTLAQMFITLKNKKLIRKKSN